MQEYKSQAITNDIAKINSGAIRTDNTDQVYRGLTLTYSYVT